MGGSPSQTSTTHMVLTNTSGVGLQVDSSDNAFSTTTGAAVVDGGLAVGRDTYVGGTMFLQSSTASTNTASGALVVAGGVGIAGALNVAGLTKLAGASVTGNATVSGQIAAASASVTTSVSAQTLYLSSTGGEALTTLGGAHLGGGLLAEGDIQTNANLLVSGTITSNAPPAVGAGGSKAFSTLGDIQAYANVYAGGDFIGAGGLQIVGDTILSGTLYTGSDTTIDAGTEATATNAGALVVTGGTGMTGNLYVGGAATVTGALVLGSTTEATSSGAGAMVIAGGVGVAKSVVIGSGLHVAGATTLSGALAASGSVAVASTTDSTSSATGSLTTTGGVGVAKSMYVGGSVSANGVTAAGANSLALAGSTAGNATTVTASGSDTDVSVSVVPKGAGVVRMGAGANQLTASGAGTGSRVVLGAVGSDTDIGLSLTPKGAGTVYVPVTTQSTSNMSGAITTDGGLGVAKNVFVGGAASVSGALSVTGTVALSTALGVPSGGTGLTSVTTGDLLYASGANTLAKLPIGTSGYVLSATGSGPTWVTPPATTSTTAYTITNSTGTTLSVQSTTDATSTGSGAALVAGGIGVGGSAYVGNALNVAGSSTLATVSAGAIAASRATTTGNIGINTGLSSWNSTAARALELQLGGTTTGSLHVVNGSVGISQNSYYNASGFWAYNTTDASSIYWQQGGAHHWGIAASGSAGSTIAYTDALVLSTTGQLAVNTSTDATTIATGAMTIAGGLGVAKSLYVGSTLDVAYASGLNALLGSVRVTSDGSNNYVQSGNSSRGAGSFIPLKFGAYQSSVNIIMTLNSTNVSVEQTTDSSSSTTGALISAGGLGVSKNVYVGGSQTVSGDIFCFGSNGIIAASNIATLRNGTAIGNLGSLVVQSGLVSQGSGVIARGWNSVSGVLPLTATSKFGSKSLDLTGTAGTFADDRYTALPNLWPLVSTNWTVEFWLYFTCTVSSPTYPTILDSRGYISVLVQANNAGLLISLSSTGGTYDLASAVASPALTSNVWNHVALEFDGSNYYCYVHNGTSSSRTLIASTATKLYTGYSAVTYGYWCIGRGNNALGQIGYLDDFRWSSNVRYGTGSTTHTPPAAQLTFDTNTLTLNTFEASDSISGAQCNTGLTVGSGMPATSSTSAALAVTGGVGVTGDAYVGGLLNVAGVTTHTGAVAVTNTTSATSTLTGALNVAGGLGVQGATYLNNNAYVVGSITANVYFRDTTGYYIVGYNSTIDGMRMGGWAGAELGYYSNGSTFNQLLRVSSTGATVTGGLSVSGTTDASSTTTGAITTAGGLGVQKSLYVGSALNVAGSSTLATVSAGALTASSASLTSPLGAASGGLGINTSATAAGGIPYTSAIGTWSTLAKSTDGYVLTLVSGAPAWQAAASNTSTGSLAVSGTTDASSSTTGSITTAGGISAQKNVYVGAALNVGTNVGMNGASSTWTSAGTNANALEIIGGGINAALHNVNSTAGLAHNIYFNGGWKYYSTAAASVYWQGAGTHNWAVVSSGTVGTSASTTASMTLNNAGVLGVTTTTDSSSSTTGAITTAGGLGVMKSMYVGSGLNVAGSSTLATVTGATAYFSDATNSTSATTGAVTLAGGLGVAGKCYFGNTTVLGSTTDSTSSVSGAMTVVGGIGVMKSIYAGGNMTASGSVTANAGMTVYGGNGLLVGSNINTPRSATSATTGGLIVQTGLVANTNAVLPRGWITIGTPLPLSSSTYKFGSKSLDLTGTAGTLTSSYIALPNFWPYVTTQSWTLEFWLYHTCTATSSFPNVVSTGIPSILVQSRDTNLIISLSSTGGTYNIANAVASPTLTANAWNHVALEFDGSAYYCYVHNGTSSSRVTVATSTSALYTVTSTITYGYWSISTNNSGKGQIGYIDDFRVSWTTRYSTASSTHTPPASQLVWDANTITLNIFEASDCASGAQCNFGLIVGSGLPATSTTSAALAVTGGAGVTGDVYVGGSSTITGNLTVAGNMTLSNPLNATSGGLGLNTSAVATGALPYTSGTGTWSTLGAGTNGYVLTMASGVPAWQASSGGSATTGATFAVTSSATNSTTFSVAGTYDSTSSTTGAITVAGGIGVAKSMCIGGTINVQGNSLVTGNTIISGNSVFQGIASVSSTSTNATVFSVAGTLDSTSSTTGSMTTLGGFGVAKSVYVGGGVTASTGLSLLGGDSAGTNTLSWQVANQGGSMSIATNRLRFGAVTNATVGNATALSFPNLLASSLIGSINTSFTLEFYIRCDNVNSALNGVILGNLGSYGLRIETTNRSSGSATNILCSLGTGSSFNVANATSLTSTYPAGNVVSIVFQYHPDVQWTVYYIGNRVIANTSVSGLRLPQNFFTGLMFHQDGSLNYGLGNGDGDMSVVGVRLSTGLLYSESGNITPATTPYTSTTGTVLMNNFGTTAQSTLQANVVASESVYSPVSNVVTNVVGNEVYISSSLPTSSSTTGALNVAGGIGAQGDIIAGGGVYANNLALGGGSNTTLAVISSTDSSSSITGAMTVVGGVGVGKSVQIGTTLTTGGAISSGGTLALNNNKLYFRGIDNNHYLQYTSGGSGGMDGPDINGNLGGRLMSSTAGTVLTWSNAGVTVAGALAASGSSSLATVTGTTAYFSSTTASSSSTTGAVTVAGGLGVVGNTYVGGDVQLPTGKLIMGQGSGQNLVLSGGIGVSQTTTSTSSTTGAIQVNGGIGVGGASYYYSNVTTASRNFFYETGNWTVNTPASLSFLGSAVQFGASTGYMTFPNVSGSIGTQFTIEFTAFIGVGNLGTLLGHSSNANALNIATTTNHTSPPSSVNVKMDVGNGTSMATGGQNSLNISYTGSHTFVLIYSGGSWFGYIDGNAINASSSPFRSATYYSSLFNGLSIHYNSGGSGDSGWSISGIRVSTGLVYSVGGTTISGVASAPYAVTSTTVACNNFTLPISSLVSTSNQAEFLNASELVYSSSGNNTVYAQGVTFSKPIAITSYAASSSSTTGALTVSGGIGTQGNLYVGGNLYSNNGWFYFNNNGSTLTDVATRMGHVAGTSFLGAHGLIMGAPNGVGIEINASGNPILVIKDKVLFTPSYGSDWTTPTIWYMKSTALGGATPDSNHYIGFDSVANGPRIAGYGGAGFYNSQTSSYVLQAVMTNLTSTSYMSIPVTVDATNTTSGALQAAGGISCQKSLWTGGSVFVSDTGGTGATLKLAATGSNTYIESGSSSTSGSAATINFTSMNASATWMSLSSSDLYVNTANIHLANSGTTYGWLHVDSGPRICIEGQSSAKVSIATNGAEQFEVTSSGPVRVVNSTNSSSTTSGAFQCSGGIGVQGNGYFYGGINVGANGVGSVFNSNISVANSISMNDTWFRLRSNSDNNHGIFYLGGAIDGPKMVGNAGIILATIGSGDRLLCNSSGVTYYGSLTNGSDRRIKSNIESLDLDHCKSFIATANPVSFKFKRGDDRTTYGFIAQEVREAGFTDLVVETPYSDMDIEDDGSSAPDTVLTMSYTSITPILTKVVQSILVENAALKQQVEAQQTQINALQAKLDALISALGVTL